MLKQEEGREGGEEMILKEQILRERKREGQKIF